MKTRILSSADKLNTGADFALILDFNDVAAATTATAATPTSILAGAKCQVVGMKLLTAFNSGSLTISVGDGNSATSLMAAVQVATGSTPVFYHVGGSSLVYLVDDTIDIFWTCSNMAKTSGKLVLYLKVEDMNQWSVS